MYLRGGIFTIDPLFVGRGNEMGLCHRKLLAIRDQNRSGLSRFGRTLPSKNWAIVDRATP